MQVLNFIKSLDALTGGPPRFILNAQAALRTRGVRSEIATLYPHPQATVVGWRALAERIAARQDDVAHLHGWFAPDIIAALALARRAGLPVIVSPHAQLDTWSLSQKAFKKRAFMRLAGRRMMGSLAGFIAASEREAANLRAQRPSCAVHLATPSVEEGWFKLDPPQQPDVQTRIVFLGRLAPEKALEAVIDALGIVRREGLEVSLDLVGNGHPDYVRRLRQAAADAGATDAVAFHGLLHGSARFEIVRHAHIGVLASYQESFGLAAAELLAAARPVVLSSAVPMAEAVVTAGAGLSVTAGDAASIAQALRGLLQLRPWNLACNAARTYARTHFALAAFAEALHDAYVSAASATAGGRQFPTSS